MKCNQKRTIFDLFTIYNCDNCELRQHDEQIVIGNNAIGIYHLFDRCKSLDIEYEYLIFDSLKLKILLKDAVINQDRIWLLFEEEINLEAYYDIFTCILDSGLSIQLITL